MIQVAYPWIFIAIVLPFIFRWLFPKADMDTFFALKVPFFNELLHSFSGRSNTVTNTGLTKLKYLASLIWILLIISGSGIQWLGNPISLPQDGRDMLLAVDLSGSMQTPDMIENGNTYRRIDVVKQVAKWFIAQRQGDRIGLILFGSQPYLQTPLTFDLPTTQQMLNDATVGLAGEQTAIGDAIGFTVKQLINYPGNNKTLILLTDGGNNTGVMDPIDAAEIAKKAHVKIYTIGIGASQFTIQTAFGPRIINPSSDLDINSLKKISQITGGQFFRAEDGNTLQSIYAKLNQLEPVKSDNITVRPITPLYPWSLGLALFLSFILIGVNLWRSSL